MSLEEYATSQRLSIVLLAHVASDRPPYLESGWTTYVNPEGSPYYVNHTKHIVTDDPIRREEICKKITNWQQQLEVHVNVEGLQMPEDYEVYITVDPRSDRCRYYFVDHTAQVVFWLEEIDPERHESLNLPLVCSPSVMSRSLSLPSVAARAHGLHTIRAGRPWLPSFLVFPGCTA